MNYPDSLDVPTKEVLTIFEAMISLCEEISGSDRLTTIKRAELISDTLIKEYPDITRHGAVAACAGFIWVSLQSKGEK